MRKLVMAVLAVCLVGVGTAGADNVSYFAGTTNVTSAMAGFSTYGDMMNGMVINAYFPGNVVETRTWGTTGPGAGGAFGTGWSLTQAGDTFGDGWTLSNSSNFGSILELWIDAGPGNTVFDTDNGTDTPGSAGGWSFQRTSANNFSVNAYYRNQVALTGFPANQDIYRVLDLWFIGPTGAAAGMSGTMTFIADTDNIRDAGDISPVPEPGSMLLLGTGLLGAVRAYRKRRS